jgi:hypothetical protein
MMTCISLAIFLAYLTNTIFLLVNFSNNRGHFRCSLKFVDPQVMCDCYTPAGEPIPTNKRYNAAKIFSNPEVSAEEPWYAISPEYLS